MVDKSQQDDSRSGGPGQEKRHGPVDLSVIIVSWNVRELLAGCLQSLSEDAAFCWAAPCDRPAPSDGVATARRRTAEVIVVDNASHDDTAEALAEGFPWVQVIANRENLGFTAGNNLGLAVSRGRYVFFLNPDTRVVAPAIGILLDYLESHPAVGIAGPELRYGDGSLQSSKRHFPTLATALLESTPLAWHIPAHANRWARHYHMQDEPGASGEGVSTNGQSVDWLVGAALMARRAVVEQIGGFDERYFMYSEELDWCRRAKESGWEIAFVPGARITHYEGKSSEQAVAMRHIRFQTSRVRYFRKFHGPWAAGVLRVGLLVAFGGEWLLEAAKWLAGSKRPMRCSRLRAYALLLRSGLRLD